MLKHNFVRAACAAGVILVLPALAYAQEVGVKGGINFASMTPEEEDEAPLISRRNGLVAGIWVRTPVRSQFSFQGEGLFSEKGVKFDGRALGLDGAADLRVRYLEFPLLARADFVPGSPAARVFAVGGVAPAFRLSAQSKASFEGQEDTQDVGDQVKPFDLGLVGGAGVEIGRALIEFRYTHGLLHLNEDDNGDEDRIKNRVLSLSFGFRLR